MPRIKMLLAHFHFREIKKALAYTIGFSFLYNIFYIFAVLLNSDLRLSYLVQILLSLVSSIGFYFICTKVWTPKKEPLSLSILLRILGLQGIYILLVSAILYPLSTLASIYGLTWLSLLLQLAACGLLIGLIPLQLVIYYALFLGKKSFKELWIYVRKVFKSHYKAILNVYCTLILLIMLLDTLMGGIFSLASGFNVPQLVYSMLYMGNPMMTWMWVLFVNTLSGVPMAQSFPILFVLFVLGCFYAYLEMNFVLFMQEECVDHGTK